MPFPIYVTCPWRSLFNSGPNSKWTWMSPNPNLNGPPRVFTYPRTKYLTWPFPSILWLRSGTNMKVENLRSVPTWYKIRWPWSSTAVPFPICVTCPWRSLFNSGPNSKWTWMSPTQSTCLSHWFNNAFNKNREFGMLRTRYDSGIFGMLSTRHEGNPSWTEGSRMLAMFGYVPTVHKSLGGLERMERPPRSFERKLDLLTVGNCAEPKWPTGSAHLS